jgi:hypothetical protein
MKSFLKDYGSVLNLLPSKSASRVSKDLRETDNSSADADALRKDWEAVGKDIYWAIDKYERSHNH